MYGTQPDVSRVDAVVQPALLESFLKFLLTIQSTHDQRTKEDKGAVEVMGQMSISGKHLRGHQHIFAAHLVLSNAIVAVAVPVPVPVPVPVSIPSIHRGKSKSKIDELSKISH